ncbi:MAG: hypothetical protein HY300_08735 [Verrucomicrobia bacterium]|nr:hypothetical protein [Verrucomicrobiota bacterium]
MKFTIKALVWIGVFALLGVIGLWLSHERAKAHLVYVKEQLIAKGEKLAIAENVPAIPTSGANGVPDFLHAAQALTSMNGNQPVRIKVVVPGRARVAWRQEQLPNDVEPDLWPFVTAYVEDNRALLAEMHTALERPVFMHQLDFNRGFAMLLPHLAPQKSAAQMLNFAALLDLHQHRPDEAFTNLLDAVKFAQRGTNEPLLISQLVRIAVATFAVSTTWEALDYPRWSEPRLAELQAAWQGVEFLQAMTRAAEMERAVGGDIFRQSRSDIRFLNNLGGISGGSSTGIFEDFFKGITEDPGKMGEHFSGLYTYLSWPLWNSYPDEMWFLQFEQSWIDSLRIAALSNSIAPAKAYADAAEKRLGQPAKRFILSGMLVPALGNITKKAAAAETQRQIVIGAIALHRHKLRHGKFPADLAALVPEFLPAVPIDFMDGNPLRYRLQPDGAFLLYSIGEDGVDNGGDATQVLGVASSTWTNARDWVWPQPASPAEIAADNAVMEAKRTKK